MQTSRGWPTPVVAGNWKMNKGPHAARDFVREFCARYAPVDSESVLLFPPAISIPVVRDALGSRRDIHLGVQNIHWEKDGAFTGEISAGMAKDAGCELALIGHSERRHVFGETDEQVQRKVRAALDAGLTPVICVGETIEQRKADQVEQVITNQLRVAIDGLAGDQAFAFLLAYEPVWAIGTGMTATPADASAAHAMLRTVLAGRLGEDGENVPILYGGSVKVDNAKELVAADGVAGLLIGGASLDAEGFATICREAAAVS